MPTVYAKSARSGKSYSVNIAGTQPTQAELDYIEQRIDQIEGFGVEETQEEELITKDDKRGFFGAVGTGIDTLQLGFGSAVEGIGESTGFDYLKDLGKDIVDTNKQQIVESSEGATRLSDVEDFGSAFDYFKETLGEQVPQLASTLGGSYAGGKTGAAIGTAIVPGYGTVIGGTVGTIAGGLAANLPFFYGMNREAQKEEVEAGRREEVNEATAALTAIPQASLDYIADRILIGKIINPKWLGGGGIFTRGVKGAGFGAMAEVPTEIGQQLLERLQAGKDITSDEAIREYYEVGVAAGLIGGTVRGGTNIASGDSRNRPEPTSQLDQDLIEEDADTSQKAHFAAQSMQTEGGIGEQKLLPSPTVVDDETDDSVPDITRRRFDSLGTTKEESTRLAMNASKEFAPSSPVRLENLPEDEAAVLRRNRIQIGEAPDAPASLDEIRSRIGEAAYIREFRKQKPNLAKERFVSEDRKLFSDKEYEAARDAVLKSKKADVPTLQKAVKSVRKNKVSIETARALQRELGKRGLLNQVSEKKWEVMEAPSSEQSPSADLRKDYDEIESAISKAQDAKRAEEAVRNTAFKDGDSIAEGTSAQRIAQIDRSILGLEQQRDATEAEINRVDPQNPIVRPVDDIQREANRAVETSEASTNQQITDEYARKRQRVANSLRKALNGLGLTNRVDLVTQNVIFPEQVANDKQYSNLAEEIKDKGVIEGTFAVNSDGKRVISLAMEIYDPNLTEQELTEKIRGVMNHELIHALRNLGVFTEQEWNTLSNAAANKKRVRNINGELTERDYTYLDRAERMYADVPNYTQEDIREEAVAEMFRDYADGKLKVAGRPKTLMDRIVKFFKSLFKAHTDSGFTQASDIFQNILTKDQSKQISRRDVGTDNLQDVDAKYSIAPSIPSDDFLANAQFTNIKGANSTDQKKIKAKLFKNRELEAGTMVTVRPNLNGFVQLPDGSKSVTQTAHPAKTYGTALGYDSVMSLTDSELRVSPQKRADIYNGVTSTGKKQDKVPMAGGYGKYSPLDKSTIEQIVSNPDHILSFNPGSRAREVVGHHLFVDGDNYAVKSVKGTAVHLGTKVYVQGELEYWKESEAPKPVGDLPSSVKYRDSEVGNYKPSLSPVYKPVKHDKEVTKDILNGVSVQLSQAMAKLTNFNRLDSSGDFVDHRVYSTPDKAVEHRLKDALFMFARERGGKTLDPSNPKDLVVIARLMAAEAAVALKRDPSAIGWYGKTIDNMFEFLSTVKAGNEMLYPELSIDPEAKAAFKYVLAITSNGVAVEDNFAYTSEMFDTWKETGLFPVRGYGKRLDAMTQAFEFYNVLKRDLKYTDTQIENFLSQETTVGELKKDPVVQKLGLKVPSGEAADVKITYAYLLGPKIGNGFYMNLGGDFSALTMDVWWMRFWNRLTGNPFKQPTKATLTKNNKRIIAAINAKKKTDYEIAKIEEAMEALGLDVVTPETAAPIAQEINKLYQLDFGRVGRENDKIIKRYIKENGVGRGVARDNAPVLPVPEKTELFLAADTYSQNLDPRNPQDSPRNSTERKYMREATNMARDILMQESGVNITNADFQALMWYAEKQLLLNAGVKPGRGADNDYLDGAIAVAKQKGFTDEQIAEALPTTERHRVDVTGDFTRADEGVSSESDFQSTSGSIRYSIKGGRRAAIDVRIGVGFNGRAFRRRDGGTEDSQYDIEATYDVSGNSARIYGEHSVSTPRFIELRKGARSAQQFSEAINSAKASLGQFGESVFVYPVESGVDADGYPETGYQDMRLFLTEDGTGGFALKQTDIDGAIDIVSVFNSAESPNKQVNYPMIRLAVEEGGNMLDAFDIYLPNLYSANGFKIRSRLKWDNEQAPDGWDKEAFKNYNNGEPDVVFMYYQPDRVDVYERDSGEGEVFTDYMEAVEAQMGAAISNQSVNRFKDAEAAQSAIENNPQDLLSEDDNAQLSEVRQIVDKSQKYDGTKYSMAPGPNAFIAAPLKTKTQYEYGYIVDGGRKIPVFYTYGQHVELGNGRTGGYGMRHMKARNHIQEVIDSGFPSIEKAFFDMMYRWGSQGYRDGAEVIAIPDGGRDLRMEYDAGKKGKIIASLKFGMLSGQPVYVLRTVYPDGKKKKQSIAYSAPYNPNLIQNQVDFAQQNIQYGRAHKLLSKVLGIAYTPNKAEDIAENFLQKFQDSMLPVGRMIDFVNQQGGNITNVNDTYLREELYHGLTGSKITDQERKLYTPMANVAKSINVSDSDFARIRSASNYVAASMDDGKGTKQSLADAYLYARHAQERNAYINSIDPENTKGSGMGDAEAQDILNFVDSLPAEQRQRFLELGRLADEIVKSTNDIRVAGGLIPNFNDGEGAVNETTGEVVNVPDYTSYVPLRGILDPESEANEQYSGRPSSRPKFGARGREDRRALGRYGYAEDIMANLMHQNQNSIIRSERNRVGQSFVELLRNEPTLTASYARIISQRPTMRVLSGGIVKTRPDPRFADRDDILVVKEAGKETYVEIDDARIALAMKGSTGLSPQKTGGLVKILGKVNRYLSNINTSYNPEFVVTNLLRDIQTAGVNISQYEMNGLTKEIMLSLPKQLAGIRRAIRDGDTSSQGAKDYLEFVRAGGQNSLNTMNDLSDQIENLDKIMSDISDGGRSNSLKKTKEGFGKIFQLLEDYNTVAENGIRVATFKALRSRIGDERAAQAARNVTVNFAKGGEYKTFMNSMYLFYNASLQGSFALLNAALRSGKVRTLWVNAVIAGALLDQMNSAFSEDDEDGKKVYDKIPDYILERNLVIMTDAFTDRGYIKIPMPYGLNMAVNMGRSMSRAGRGGYTASEATSSLVGTILDTLNPIGDTPRIPIIDKDFAFEDLFTTISPSAGDPFVQYFTNSDYARNPIYKEGSPFGVPTPESQSHWTTTSPNFKAISNFLRQPFGIGDASDVRPGFIEVSPDLLEFWFDYATGGVGRFVKMSTDLVTDIGPKALTEGWEEDMYRSVPFARKAIGSVSEREDIGSYIEKRDRVLLTRKDFLDARKKGDIERAQRIQEAYGEELKVSGLINALNNTRNKLVRKRRQVEANTALPDAQKEILLERIDEKIKEVMTRANTIMATL